MIDKEDLNIITLTDNIKQKSETITLDLKTTKIYSVNSNIKITFTKQAIIFESLDTDSVANTQVDIDLNIPNDFYIAVNAKYILDFLSMTTSDKIKIGFNESNLPFYLEDNKFITIVMPIVLEK